MAVKRKQVWVILVLFFCGMMLFFWSIINPYRASEHFRTDLGQMFRKAIGESYSPAMTVYKDAAIGGLYAECHYLGTGIRSLNLNDTEDISAPELFIITTSSVQPADTTRTWTRILDVIYKIRISIYGKADSMTEKTNSKTATSGISDSNRAPRQFLATITPAQAMDFIGRAGENTYRAKQLYDWVAKKWITDPASMTNLPASLKEKIKENFLCAAVKIEQDSECADGSRKLLLSLSDGETVECALIPAQDGRMTFCLSTQVGCPVACAFCASGSAGFVRNLHAGEIIEEYLLCCRLTGKAPGQCGHYGRRRASAQLQ